MRCKSEEGLLGTKLGELVQGRDAFRLFRRITECFQLPPGEGDDKLRHVARWLEALPATWQRALGCKVSISIDETMVFWTRASEAHITFMPRQPSPLGVMFKTTACGASDIMLNIEAVRGLKRTLRRSFVLDFKATHGFHSPSVQAVVWLFKGGARRCLVWFGPYMRGTTGQRPLLNPMCEAGLCKLCKARDAAGSQHPG